MSKIIRYCKLKEEHSGPNAFDISRPNIFGNPYTHIKNRETKALVKVKTRDEAVDMYDPYFDNMLKDNTEVGDRFRTEWDKMYDAYKTYDEIYIGCYCELNQRCHSEVIIRKLVQRSMREKLSKLRESRKLS